MMEYNVLAWQEIGRWAHGYWRLVSTAKPRPRTPDRNPSHDANANQKVSGSICLHRSALASRLINLSLCATRFKRENANNTINFRFKSFYLLAISKLIQHKTNVSSPFPPFLCLCLFLRLKLNQTFSLSRYPRHRYDTYRYIMQTEICILHMYFVSIICITIDLYLSFIYWSLLGAIFNLKCNINVNPVEKENK